MALRLRGVSRGFATSRAGSYLYRLGTPHTPWPVTRAQSRVFAALPIAVLVAACTGPEIAIPHTKVNLRAAPADSAAVLSTATSESYLDIGGTNGDWVAVKTEAGVAYVFRCLVSVVPKNRLAEYIEHDKKAAALFKEATDALGLSPRGTNCEEQCRGIGSKWGSPNEGIVKARCLEKCKRLTDVNSTHPDAEKINKAALLLSSIVSEFEDTQYYLPALNLQAQMQLTLDAEGDPRQTIATARSACAPRLDQSLSSLLFDWAERNGKLDDDMVTQLAVDSPREKMWFVGDLSPRMLPSEKTPEAFTLRFGDPVETTGQLGGWSRIAAGSKPGWVKEGNLVTFQPPSLSREYFFTDLGLHRGSCEAYLDLKITEEGGVVSGRLRLVTGLELTLTGGIRAGKVTFECQTTDVPNQPTRIGCGFDGILDAAGAGGEIWITVFRNDSSLASRQEFCRLHLNATTEPTVTR